MLRLTEEDKRLAKANSSFCRLCKCVWNNRNPKRVSKVKVYKAIIVSTLLHGAESRVMFHYHLHLLQHFHQCCLHTILKICWSDFITNTQVLDIAVVTSIEAKLLKIQLCWVGHASRKEDIHLPKSLSYEELFTGYCKRCALQKKYKDSMNKTLTTCGIDHHQ